LGDPRATGAVTDCLDHGNRDLRRAAAAALDHLAPAAAGDRLFAALDDDDWEVRLAAVRALRQIASPRAVAALAGAAASDPDPLVRNAAAQSVSSAHRGTDEEL
jgi:HEAT repeat protein